MPPAPGAVIIAERRAAGLTETVAKAAAGALEYLPVVRAVNINQTLRSLKDEGYFVYGLDENGEQPFDAVDWPPRTVIVMGAEGKGLHDLVKKNCDALVRIPMAGKIASLNVSVATGIVLFAWRSRRDAKVLTSDLPFDSQIVLNVENAGNGVRPDIADVAVHLIRDHAFQPHISVLHDDVDGGQRLVSVARGKQWIAVDRAKDGAADPIVIRRTAAELRCC